MISNDDMQKIRVLHHELARLSEAGLLTYEEWKRIVGEVLMIAPDWPGESLFNYRDPEWGQSK